MAQQVLFEVRGGSWAAEDFTGEAAWMRDDLALLIKELKESCEKFEESKQRYLEREARKAEKITARKVLSTEGTLTLSGR